MTPGNRRTTSREFALVLLLFGVAAYGVAPFALGEKTALTIVDRDPDAIQQCLLVGAGMDRLLTHPGSYYDTAVLFPDRNQLRTTEPFLGYALLGLPLRVLTPLNDVDIFEVLRWTLAFVSLLYAFKLFTLMGITPALAVAGAVLCISQADLLTGIERLQLLSIPLVIPVLYHFLRAWQTLRARHSVALFAFAALYPLCGMVNGVIVAMAAIFLLPLLVRMLLVAPRRPRLVACVLPILLAAAVDVAATGPWLLDRADLKAYERSDFLQTKRWNPMQVPIPIGDVPGFVAARAGIGPAAALSLLAGLLMIRRRREEPGASAETGRIDVPDQAFLWLPLLSGVAILVGTAYFPRSTAVSVLTVAFNAACYLALLLLWRRQATLPLATNGSGLAPVGLILSGGVGVMLCLMSFGPIHASNNSLLATHLMKLLLQILPPLASIREFERIWIFGLLFVSIYATLRLGIALRSSRPITRTIVAAAIVGAALVTMHNRDLVATSPVEAPRDFIDLASTSKGRGALYVHPYMRWNTLSGVLMIPIAKELGRPVVNGSLGIAPPWFGYATSVLHRFPDPEAMWLLRTWHVETVVSLVGAVPRADPASLRLVFERRNGAVYEIVSRGGDAPHPSGGTCEAADGDSSFRIGASPAELTGEGSSITLFAPGGFKASCIEVHFRLSAVDWVPASIGVFATRDGRRARVNLDGSGEWLESLAAEALVRRAPPVAAIRLNGPVSGRIDLACSRSARPPVDHLVLRGQWAR